MFARKNKKQRNSRDPVSKPVYSYYASSRSRDDKPDRARQIEPARQPGHSWLHHLPSIVAILVILGCLGYILSINSDPRIVELSGNQGIFLHQVSDYQQAAQKLIAKSWLNDNKVTLNAESISQHLKAEFPELSDVSVTIPLVNRRPVIYVASSQPALLLVGTNSSMIIDARGVAIMSSTQNNDSNRYNLITVKDESGLNLTTGQTVLPAANVKFITDTFTQFKAANETVSQFSLPPKANELDVKLATKPYYIKMDMTGDSREEVGAYLASTAKIISLGDKPSQYIDVRVPGRVYYK